MFPILIFLRVNRKTIYRWIKFAAQCDQLMAMLPICKVLAADCIIYYKQLIGYHINGEHIWWPLKVEYYEN